MTLRALLRTLSRLSTLTLFLALVATSPAIAGDVEPLGTSPESDGYGSDWRPFRQNMYTGLDLGVSLGKLHGSYEAKSDSLPTFLRVSLRPGYCIRPWVHVGIDWDMHFLMSADGGSTFNAPLLLQPSLTFFLYRGLYLHGAGGFDPMDLSPSATGAAGYEFAIGNFGGIGLGFSFTQLWRNESHKRKLRPWQLYGMLIQFTSYDSMRDFFPQARQ